MAMLKPTTSPTTRIGAEVVSAIQKAFLPSSSASLNSRLASRIRVKEGLSYGVGSSLFAHPADEFGQFVTFAIYAPENGERLEAVFKEELERMLAEGFTAEEVESGKQGYLEFQKGIRARDPVLASQLSQALYFNRTLEWEAELERKIAALTPEQINEAMRRHIDPEKISIVMAGDFAKVKAGAQPEKQ